MRKLYATVLMILIPYGTWKVYDFFTPDFCTYTDFRYDQHYYFKRYNSFWYGIYEYPSRKLFKKVYQRTPCNGSEILRYSEGEDDHLSVHWGTDDIDIYWRNGLRSSLKKKTISGLKQMDRKLFDYEVLYRERMSHCMVKQCYDKEEKKLKDEYKIDKNHFFTYTGALEAQLECLEKANAYPENKSTMPEQCKAEFLINLWEKESSEEE